MKSFFALCALLFLFSCTNALKEHQNSADDYAVIPKPMELTQANGRFLIDDNISIHGSQSLNNEMVFLNEILLNNTGQSAAILLDDAASKTSKNIYLNLNPAMKGDESYTLVVDFDALQTIYCLDLVDQIFLDLTGSENL